MSYKFDRPLGRDQAGSFLLEALIAILIVSLGILGLVGMQAQSIRFVSDAQYRGEATSIVNSYISNMWAAKPDNWVSQYGDPSQPGTPAEAFMKNDVWRLPGAKAISTASENPTIEITSGPATVGSLTLSTTASLVTVTVWWLLPGEDPEVVDPVDKKGHKYVASGIIGLN